MCNCPSTKVTRAGFVWREITHTDTCSTPSPDTLIGYLVK